MKIFGMGMPELVVILIVALLIFGPKNLPKLGSALGKTVKNLREGMDTGTNNAEGEEELTEEAEEAEDVVEEQPAPKKAATKKTNDQAE